MRKHKEKRIEIRLLAPTCFVHSRQYLSQLTQNILEYSLNLIFLLELRLVDLVPAFKACLLVLQTVEVRNCQLANELNVQHPSNVVRCEYPGRRPELMIRQL